MLQIFLLVGLFWTTSATCPHLETGLTSFSTLYPSPTDTTDVTITTNVLLNVPLLDVRTITISGSGRLIFNRGLDITVKTNSILVKESGQLIIGSSTCRHTDDVTIYLKGSRTADRTQLTDAGEKFIAVQDSGVLQIYGEERLAWTKLEQTVERFNATPGNVEFSHAMTNWDVHRWNEGLSLYVFNSTLKFVGYKVYDFVKPNNNKDKEQGIVNGMVKDLNDNIKDNDIVAISLQNWYKNAAGVSFDALYDKIEDLAGITRGKLLLREAVENDAFTLLFVKGANKFRQALDVPRTSKVTEAIVDMDHGGKKLTAVSKVYQGRKQDGNIDFRILSHNLGYPSITVLDKVKGIWKKGDEVLLTSTDFSVKHAEIVKIKDIVSDNTVKLERELEYRHFGKIENGVDMRAEVALLSRNIRIEGVMGPCVSSRENCNLGHSSYGGHIKIIKSFGSTVIDGVALRYMGQAFDKGFYPIHYHVCGNITGRPAIVRQNVIRDSYARALTVHGTFGVSKTHLGVKASFNVAHNIYGHSFFTEDGSEIGTYFYKNIASRVKNIDNGFATDKSKATGFWITNPKTILINNIATGCDGHGFWHTFPLKPVGLSDELGFHVYAYKEAKHTPLWMFDNNVAHSNGKNGYHFDNILQDDNGAVAGCMRYEPVSEPLKPGSSTPVYVPITRFTGYKNFQLNMWIRGGLFDVNYFSSAESRKGLQAARASSQPQFIRNSVFIGRSAENGEIAGYPDAVTPTALQQHVGFVVYDGPVYLNGLYFDGFYKTSSEPDDKFFATAFGFKRMNKFHSSVMTSSKNMLFGRADTVGGSSLRVFDGHIINDDQVFAFGNLVGDESATMRDLDGTLSRCPGDSVTYSQLVKPEKYTVTENCLLRDNWQMAICNERYGKVGPNFMLFEDDVNDPNVNFNNSGQMRRRRFSDTTDYAFKDYDGSTQTNFLTVLGNKEFYYDFQYSGKVFPKTVRLTGSGIERDYPLVVGLCLPSGITQADLSIIWENSDFKFKNDDVRWVNKIEDIKPTGFPQVFLKERILYTMLSSRARRNTHWDAYDYGNCPGGTCPNVEITVAKNLPLTECFTVPDSEIDAEYYNVTSLARQTCELPASQRPLDWGAGDTMLESRNGGWGEWGIWSKCCNNATNTEKTTRHRMCDSPPKYGNGNDCTGPATETKDCEVKCAVNGVWTDWSVWSDCNCGTAAGSTGVSTRTRDCQGTNNKGQYCSGAKEDYENCDGDCS